MTIADDDGGAGSRAFPAVVGAKRSAEAIGEAIRDLVDRKGHCVMALGGGRSPANLYVELESLDLPWHAVHVIQTDERLGGKGDGHNWASIAATGLLDRVEGRHRNPVSSHLEPEEARLELADAVSRSGGVDLAVFGVGPDGHVASLVGLQGGSDLDTARVSEHEGTTRVTLSAAVLSGAKRRYVAVNGRDRLRALDDALGRRDDEVSTATRTVLSSGPTTLCHL